MPSFWTLIFLTFTFTSYYYNFSEAKHVRKSPSTVVVGTVYCNTCLPDPNHFIAGASVQVQCNVRDFRKEVKTNNVGEFRVRLPFHVKKLSRHCSIRLVRSNEASCPVPATATSSSLHLKSRKEGIHVYSAGFFSFKPQVCHDKNEKLSSKKKTDQLPFLPIPWNPPVLPPNPLLPPPSILPPLNPFQPPPSVIPPIFPTPPPSIFPPILPIPTTPPFNLPPFPGLVPSPPPPPPTFPIPLPPFPFQPTPGFPGVPPADVSSHSRTTSP